MTQVLKNRLVQINNRFSTQMQVEDEVEVEAVAKVVVEQGITSSSSLMIHNNNIQVEEASLEAGGVIEVVVMVKGKQNDGRNCYYCGKPGHVQADCYKK